MIANLSSSQYGPLLYYTTERAASPILTTVQFMPEDTSSSGEQSCPKLRQRREPGATYNLLRGHPDALSHGGIGKLEFSDLFDSHIARSPGHHYLHHFRRVLARHVRTQKRPLIAFDDAFRHSEYLRAASSVRPTRPDAGSVKLPVGTISWVNVPAPRSQLQLVLRSARTVRACSVH